MAKATSASVRRVRGGFIVQYKTPAASYAAYQQAALGMAAAAASVDQEVVCDSLSDVQLVLTELLGDG